MPVTESELAELVRAGRAAGDRLLLSNLRLVQKLAGQEARRSGLPLDDLFQEGCLALAGALQRFDPDRGRFTSYAAGRIGRHLSALAAVRLGALGLPVSEALALRRLRGLLAQRAQERSGPVRAADVAELVGCDPLQAERLLRHRSPVELVSPDSHPAITADGADPDRPILDEQLRREVGRLGPELALVVRLRFGIGCPEPMELGEIAEHLGVSLSTARRRELQALDLLRQRLVVRGFSREALAS